MRGPHSRTPHFTHTAWPWQRTPCLSTYSTEVEVVQLRSKQGRIFEVEKEAACLSITVKNTISETGLDDAVPLLVDSDILEKVIEYCNHHVGTSSEDFCEDQVWDDEFVKVRALPRRAASPQRKWRRAARPVRAHPAASFAG